MRIYIPGDGTYPSLDLLRSVFFSSGTYEVQERVQTLDGKCVYYIIKNNIGEEARVLEEYCTVVVSSEHSVEKHRYVYVVVRTDLKPHQIINQVAHAAYESGLAFKNHADKTTIITLGVQNEKELLNVEDDLHRKVQFCKYSESTGAYGYTSLASEPVTYEQRRLFRKYKLLNLE